MSSELDYIVNTADGGFPTLTLGPMFPGHVQIGGASIKLNADGTWEGDRDAFLAALVKAKHDHSGFAMPILWLIANAISRV